MGREGRHQPFYLKYYVEVKLSTGRAISVETDIEDLASQNWE